MAVDFESAASVKVCETSARVNVFVIGGSELKLKKIIVEKQGSYIVTSKVRTGLALSCCGVAFVDRLKLTVLPINK